MVTQALGQQGPRSGNTRAPVVTPPPGLCLGLGLGHLHCGSHRCPPLPPPPITAPAPRPLQNRHSRPRKTNATVLGTSTHPSNMAALQDKASKNTVSPPRGGRAGDKGSQGSPTPTGAPQPFLALPTVTSFPSELPFQKPEA